VTWTSEFAKQLADVREVLIENAGDFGSCFDLWERTGLIREWQGDVHAMVVKEVGYCRSSFDLREGHLMKRFICRCWAVMHEPMTENAGDV
jgi:hypothetical protein